MKDFKVGDVVYDILTKRHGIVLGIERNPESKNPLARIVFYILFGLHIVRIASAICVVSAQRPLVSGTVRSGTQQEKDAQA